MVVLTALPVAAQLTPVPHAANATVSDAEVTAFMQAQQKDMKAMLTIRNNPKRVPLLLGAIKRDPAGRWASDLHGCCFVEDRASAWRLPPAERPKVLAGAVVYLSTAHTTISKALEKAPQNLSLKYNLNVIDQSLAVARREAAAPTNEVRTATSPRPAANNPPRVDAAPPGNSTPAGLRAKSCGSSLTQIDLAKEMWQVDNNKPGTATPTVADLSYYLPGRKLPSCPEGGVYVIGRIDQKPRCSVPGHVLPPRSK
jgi:hypothetical protein